MRYYGANVQKHWGAPYHTVYFAMKDIHDRKKIEEFCRKEWNLTKKNCFGLYPVKPAEYLVKALTWPQSNSENFWNYSHSIMVTL